MLEIQRNLVICFLRPFQNNSQDELWMWYLLVQLVNSATSGQPSASWGGITFWVFSTVYQHLLIFKKGKINFIQFDKSFFFVAMGHGLSWHQQQCTNAVTYIEPKTFYPVFLLDIMKLWSQFCPLSLSSHDSFLAAPTALTKTSCYQWEMNNLLI